MYYVGIDVGGTTIKSGLVDEAGQVAQVYKRATPIDDLKSFASALFEDVAHFREQAPVVAVGVGIPGLRSSKTHAIKVSPNIPCLKDVNLELILADRIQLPVFTENDANVGAYAEFSCGAARGLTHMAYLTIGTGLGSGLILSGQLFGGSTGYAGEMGHTVVEPRGRLCNCGNRGCLETIVSATGMVTLAAEKLAAGSTSTLRAIKSELTAEAIFNAAVHEDELARVVFRETARYLGIACANLINLLNVEMIVIGGGVMASRQMLLQPAIEEAQSRAFEHSFRACRIVPAQLGFDAGMIGAAMLARNRSY